MTITSIHPATNATLESFTPFIKDETLDVLEEANFHI